MQDNAVTEEGLRAYPVWDRTVRWFHWINVLCILGLAGLGLIILNAGALGVSADGKVLLKTWHAYIGYVFALNLLWRLLWGWIGSHYARWSQIVPWGRGYSAGLRNYLRGARAGDPPAYRGHNPLGRLMIGWLFLLLSAQMVTGLVLAGTDLYMPPFGHEFAEWATGAGEDHSKIQGLEPGDKSRLDPDSYAQMREFRAPFIEIHKIAFYLLMISIALHVAAVVHAEVRDREGLVSAMFSGRKVLRKPPSD